MRSLTTSSTSRCSTTTRWARTTGWVGWRLTWGSWVERWTIVEFYIFGQFCIVWFYVLGLPCSVTRAILFLRWATTFGGRSRRARASSMWSSPSAEPQRFFFYLEISSFANSWTFRPTRPQTWPTGTLIPNGSKILRSATWVQLSKTNKSLHCLTRIL